MWWPLPGDMGARVTTGDMLPPVPPADLLHRLLPVHTLEPGSTLFRIHQSARGPKHFGRSGLWRFDAPDAGYRTLYAGLRPEVAFAETMLRGPGTLVAASELASRALCRFIVVQPMRLVQLYGRHLVSMGANASVTSGPYAHPQSWSGALHAHPEAPDGILYRATHDNDELAVVVFDRAAGLIDDGASVGLLSDLALLGRLLNHYKAAIR